MKKYLFGLSAIVMAVAFSAFTKPAKRPFALNDYFYRIATFSASDVANLANYELATGSVSCPGAAQKACRISVDTRDTQTLTDPNTGLPYTAPANVSITPAMFDASTYKVSAVSTVSGHTSSTFANQQK